MKHLWAPWRVEYLESERPGGCIFCLKPAEKDDVKNHIVHRGETCFVMLNRYPYNNGHLMISPFRHIGDMRDLTDDEMAEIMILARHGTAVLKELMSPDGFNLGINAGEAAGAGFGDHIHMHLVPRWAQDTNFMPVIADTRVLSESLEANHKRLVEKWNSLNE